MKPRKECPEVPDDVAGACAEMCPAEGCPAGEMCCSNGCGHVCKSGMLFLFKVLDHLQYFVSFQTEFFPLKIIPKI